MTRCATIAWAAWGRDVQDYENARAAILKEMRGGLGIVQACKAVGVSRDACWRWRKEYPAFDREVQLELDRQSVEREIARQERREAADA